MSSDVVEEKLKLEKLRERISDVLEQNEKFKHDFYLFGFLRAGKFDVSKAEEVIRESMKWRKENRANELRNTPMDPEIANCFRMYTDGLTKNGLPAWSANAGSYRFRDTISRFGKEAVIKYWIQVLMNTEDVVFKHNLEAFAHKNKNESINDWPNSKKCWLILNMKNLSYGDVMSRDVISVFLNIVKIAVTYFPTHEGTVCFVNAGRLMEVVLKLIKPLVRGTSVDIQVFDSNEEKWKEHIRQYVDPEQIREPFGGLRRVSLCFS